MRWTSVVLMSVLLMCASMASIPLNAATFEAKDSFNHAVENSENTDLALGWVASAGGTFDDYISQTTVYVNGTYLVAGSYEGDLQFRDQIEGHSSAGPRDLDAFLGWVNPNGTWIASITFGSSGLDSIDAVALLSNGDAIVAGTYCVNSFGTQCELVLDGVDPLTKDSANKGNVFLARLNHDGVWAWATQIGNEYDNLVIDMMVTSTDEIHLGVLYKDTMDFNGEVLPVASQTSMLIAVYDEGGNPQTHVVLRTQDSIDFVGGLCLDGAGQTYVAATFNGEVRAGQTVLNSNGQTDLMVASYEASEWAWAISGGSVNEDRAWGCSGAPTQGISVVGEFIGNATFGEFTTETSDRTDLILASVSSSGAWSGIATAGGPGVDRATGIVTNTVGDIVITGTTSAGLIIGSDQLDDLDNFDDSSYNDIFLASYLENDSWAWAVSAGGEGNDEPTDLTLALDGSPLLTFMVSSTANFGVHSATSYGGYDVGVWLYQTDRDSDGILDGEDNCPRVTNTAQGNHDGDLFGDDCDDDDDNDGVLDAFDDCQTGEMNWASDASTDHDSDGCQDSGEDFDDDEDTVFDFADLCPLGPVGWISTTEEDSEGDGCADYDTDEDGFVDQMDNCPSAANPSQSDLDDDGLGDACDVDEDGDGVAQPEDNCPRDTESWASTNSNDYDQDGCQDATNDDDDDNDGYNDAVDACPTGAINWNVEGMNSQLDHDQDGCKDAGEDIDDDDDGFQDLVDACPVGVIGVALPGQDADADGCIDGAEDDDDDNDGVKDDVDACPKTPTFAQVGVQGCSMSQLDDDLDGVSNADDMCLNSLPGRVVDALGCAIINQSNDQISSSDDTDMTTWLFILAGVLLVAAGAVTLSGNQKRNQTKELLPKRPVRFDKARDTTHLHEAE